MPRPLNPSTPSHGHDYFPNSVKKAYHKLSLKFHPDRVAEDEKTEATEKFKVLSKLYSVLTDKNKKALYDDKGVIDDDDERDLSSWLELWRSVFKPITTQDIQNYERDYRGSEQEEIDIRKAYLNGKGCINFMMNHVPFMAVEDEERIQELVRKWIDEGDVPEHKLFTEEPKAKKQRRHKKYARESLEARENARKLEERGTSLEQMIAQRNEERQANASNFFASLLDKYEKKEKVRKSIAGKNKSDRKDSLHDVKEGKVKKTRR